MNPSRERWLDVEIRHLAALDAVARERSFRGAAGRLGYVQSAVSQQVSHLERLVGARLVERSRGSAHVALTRAGDVLLEHIETILARLGAARDDLAALAEGRAGTVRVGAIQSVATRLLPDVLARFALSSPDVRVAPIETPTDVPLLELVERGELDVAFCELPVRDGPFDAVELIDDPFVLLVSTRSALAGRAEPPSLSEIVRLPLVGLDRSRWQERLGIDLELTHRVDLDTTVQALVAAGIGVAIAPRLCVDPRHPGTRTIELPELPPRTLALVWHSARALRPAAAAFAATVRAAAPGWRGRRTVSVSGGPSPAGGRRRARACGARSRDRKSVV